MAPAVWDGPAREQFYATNAQDVGGLGKEDKFAAVGQPFEDAADTDLSVALKKTEKPVKYW